MFGFLSGKKQKLAVVAGASRFGTQVAGIFSGKGYEVVIIDTNGNAFSKLADNFEGLTIEGDASDTFVLEGAHIKKASVCVAATNSDSTNSLIAQITACVYMVPGVYCRLSDAANTDMLTRSRIHIICPSDLCLQEFERQSGLEDSRGTL
jgi:K+ transport systems, NAD-binding component